MKVSNNANPRQCGKRLPGVPNELSGLRAFLRRLSVKLGGFIENPWSVPCSYFFAKEAGLAMVSVLDNMQWNTIKLEARTPGHAGKLAWNY